MSHVLGQAGKSRHAGEGREDQLVYRDCRQSQQCNPQRMVVKDRDAKQGKRKQAERYRDSENCRVLGDQGDVAGCG